VDFYDAGNHTPLHLAALLGDVDTIKLLLKARGRVNATNNYRWTPLHFAVSQGHFKVARLLLKARANPNILTADQTSVQHLLLMVCVECFECVCVCACVCVCVCDREREFKRVQESSRELGERESE
jgi:Ankyrin repeats (3 copies)